MMEYDDRQLIRLFEGMDAKHRLKALKGAFRREANAVRKVAINNLRQSIHSSRDLERGVRALVFKRKAGFRVTIGTKKANRNGKGEAGFHTNRQGLKKPILIWAEEGTAERRTKTITKNNKRQRRGHPTGRMRKYAFMRHTKHQVASKVEGELRKEIVDNITRVAKKYGCE